MSMSTVYDKHTADGMLPVGSGEHFAVLEFVNVTIPGDERSRTHPGHGYPESTEQYTKFHVFTSQQRLEEWLSETRGSNYVVLAARRIGVKTRAIIEFE
ncbi:hypothetical protein EVB87_055 [Rhizobium phage RHph_N28_1]|nr:hypothetical protein EVB87_055 [Rhizobium phage RHph_N28_1]QIG74083.1 hypothetical protein EVC07_055 [Rhizobium phage RHph_N42]QXV73743.1 hypothetical protein [Rhizobium phage RHph_N46]